MSKEVFTGMLEDKPTGDELRDQGIARTSAVQPDYIERFNAEAAKLLDRDGVITSEDVVDVIGLPSGSKNAVGAAMRTFAKRNRLAIAGYVKAKRASRHSAIIAVWSPAS